MKGPEKNNDEQNLIEEYLKIKNQLIYFAQQITKNREDAEDIVSKTIERLILLENEGRLNMYDSNHKNYLYKAVKNMSLNLIRDKKRRLT